MIRIDPNSKGEEIYKWILKNKGSSVNEIVNKFKSDEYPTYKVLNDLQILEKRGLIKKKFENDIAIFYPTISAILSEQE